MQPRLLKTEQVPVDLDRVTLHSMACAYVEELFSRKGEMEPTWLIGEGRNMASFETPWGNPLQKEFVVQHFRALFKRIGIEYYSLAVEAWVFNTRVVPKDEQDKWLKLVRKHGLKDMPDEFKDDVVLITSFDKDDGFSISQYKVTIRENGLNFLGPRVDNPMGDEKFTGRMWNLLLPEVKADWKIPARH